jgi:hypothetical protein
MNLADCVMNTVCFGVPAISFVATIFKSWDAVQWIHAPKLYEAKMTARKKEAETWRTKGGQVLDLTTLETRHLSNSIKMVARNGMKSSYLGDIKSDKLFLKLTKEARRRGWKVTFLKSPIEVDGRKEYVDVWVPTPRSKLAAGFILSDLDSRPNID